MVFIAAVVIAVAADDVAVAVAVAAFLLVAAVDLAVVEKPFDLPKAHCQQVCSFR